ncbi:MAG: prepilin-type N-terminal cleavage/methylation domain-containing protein [Bacilli bacterium]|nr:prepilin-type N-terminal cleavage/methylation domain-containing protein [Bacilli bacterium]
MKNNKGFTLIELLAVLLVLSIILLLAFPNFASLSKQAKLKIDASTKVLLKSAAKIYVDNFQEDVDDYLSSNSFMCIPVGKLIAYEFIDADLKTGDGKEIEQKKCINVSKTTRNGKTVYEYDTSLVNEIPNGVDFIPPVIFITPTAENLNESVLKCSTIVNTTYENFQKYCEVKVTDDKDGSIRLNEPSIYESVNDNNEVTKKLVEYTAQDVTGNKAIPLKIQFNLN